MNAKDLEYIFKNNTYNKNIYKNHVPFRLPNIHLNYLKENDINYRFNDGEHMYKRTIDIFRKDGSIITTIIPPRYTSNSRVSYELVKNKFKTEAILGRNNINTISSIVFDKNEMDKAKLNIEDNNYPLVIKPLAGTLGKGVMVNVSKSRFEFNWKESVKYIPSNGKVIVQKYLEGFEARATIVEGNLIAITLRIPPYVIGDGENSIKELIELKNEERKNCNVLSRALIKKSKSMEEFLKTSKLNFDYKPAKGEYVLLGSVSNFSYGGELMNITNLVSEKIKDIALDTIAALPGLYTGGVDIIMKSFNDNEPTILEVNSYPVFGLAAFPTYGPPTQPSKVYFEAVISKDQFINKPINGYDIEKSEFYLENYLKFEERRKFLMNANYKSILKNYNQTI